MAKLTVEHQEEILTFPTDTILDLKIEEANVKTVQGARGDWQKVEFKFKVLDIQATGDGSPRDAYSNWIGQFIYGSVPARLTDSPENKLRIWAEAVFRQPLGLGFELDTDMFLSRRVRGLTSQYESNSRGAGGEKLKRHQIETLLPAHDSSAPAAAPAAPVAPAQDPWATPAAAAPANDPWGTGSDEPPF